MSVHVAKMLICSFCGKSHKEVYKLIAGPNCHICDECVGLCAEIIHEARAHDRITKSGKLLVTVEEAASLAWMKTWTTSKPLAQQAKGEGEGGGDAT